MRFLRNAKGCSRLERMRNENVKVEFVIHNIEERTAGYRRRWNERIDGMEESRLTKQIRSYNPQGRGDN